MALMKTAQYYLGRFELELLDPGRRRRRELHRREGAAARAQPADRHLDRRRRRCSSSTSGAGAGCSRSSRSACGVRLDRGRHDLPGGRSSSSWCSRTSTRPRADVHRPQHRGDARRVRPRRGRRRRSSTSRRSTSSTPTTRPTSSEQPSDARQRAAVGPGRRSGRRTRRSQELQTYYQFADVDVDRYTDRRRGPAGR